MGDRVAFAGADGLGEIATEGLLDLAPPDEGTQFGRDGLAEL